MKVLVTGGAGFIGSHLVDLLIKEGHEVSVLDNLSIGRLSNLSHLEGHKNLSFYPVDIRDYNEILPLFKHQDWVFHLAALADIVPSIEAPEDYFSTNVNGTFNVLQAAHKMNVKRFVYSASSSCYGLTNEIPTSEQATIQPEYPYALTKRMGEELVLHWQKVYGLPANSLRFFNVYGPRVRTTGTYGAVFGVFLAQKLNNKPYTVVGDGTQSRDFTYVSDIVQALYQTASSNLVGEVMNVGSGHHYSINELVEQLGGEVLYIPKRPGEPDITFANISKIKATLNWQPKVSLTQGVNIMLAHIEDWREAPLWEKDSIEKATASWFKYLSPKGDA